MRYGTHRQGKAKDRAYVSEFTEFIGHFLEDHPEVIDERRNGYYLYWDRKVNLAANEQAQKDSVPDDRYGFDYSAWHGTGSGTETGSDKQG